MSAKCERKIGLSKVLKRCASYAIPYTTNGGRLGRCVTRKHGLRTTFCSSRDTRVSYRWCLLIQGYFARLKTIWRKQYMYSLSKCSWYPKRKLDVTMYFSEVLKLRLKKRRTLLCILLYFRLIVAKLSLKNAPLPHGFHV